MKDKKFDLHAKASIHASFYIISGKDSEKELLKKFLTVTNKSVYFQLEKSKSLLIWWTDRARQLEGYGKIDAETESKVAFYRKQIKELGEQATVRYWEQIGHELFVPKGYWYLFSTVPSDVENDVIPVHIAGTRDYQVEAINTLMKYKRSTLSAATGSGKSIMLLNMALSYVKAGKRVMICVPSEYLVGQLYETIKAHHKNTTSCGGGRTASLGADVLVTTMQSAKQHVDIYDVIAIDEAHHLAANTWNGLMAEANAEYVHAFTATPIRMDGLALGLPAFAGPVVYEKDVRSLIREGFLMEPVIYSIEMSTIKVPDSKMATSAYKQIATSPKVMEYIKSQIIKGIASDRKIICAFKTLECGNKLKKLLKGHIDVNVASGTFKDPIHKFKSGKCLVLIGTSALLSEGLDLIEADMLIIVTQHVSDVTSFQMLGRVMRLSPGKRPPVVLCVGFDGYGQFQKAIEKRRKIYHKVSDNVSYIKG